MIGSVPLARRNLWADPRRLLVSALGVGLAVMLMLLLDGLWSGIRSQSSLCAMAVEAGDNPHLQVAGQTWWFCSAHCRDEFAAEPDRFPLVTEVAAS